jgi:hypothetical protein
VHFSNEASNVSLKFFNDKLATDITKTVWRVHTTRLDMFKAQHNENKVKVKE